MKLSLGISSKFFQAGIAAAPARAVSAVKSMNISQHIKDFKLADINLSNIKKPF